MARFLLAVATLMVASSSVLAQQRPLQGETLAADSESASLLVQHIINSLRTRQCETFSVRDILAEGPTFHPCPARRETTICLWELPAVQCLEGSCFYDRQSCPRNVGWGAQSFVVAAQV